MSELILNKTELRKFGLVMGVFIALLFGLFFPWVLEHDIPNWPWIVAGLFISWALIHPQSLKPVYHVWMKVGFVLGWINTRIILSILFYMVFLPTGLVLRLMGKDLMKLKLNKTDSYRVKSSERNKDHIERPY